MESTETFSRTPRGLYASLPLPAEQSIRLLAIPPRSSNHNETTIIRCELQVHNLKNAPAYEALSYVWGSPDPASDVMCNGVLMKIGPSLAGALRRLQNHDHTSRLLWIDALCINQDDLEERSSQVSFMKAIYELAEKVNIWLGEDDGVTEEGLDIIRTAASYCKDEMTDLGVLAIEELPGKTTDSADKDRGIIPPWTSPLWDQVNSIFARPWFSRVWVIQEASNHNVEVMIGSMAALPWRELWTAGRWFIQKGYKWASGVDVLGILVHERAAHSRNKPSSIGQWLYEIGHFRATNPRDRAYALYGLAKEAVILKDHPLTAPNYENSVVDVFQGLTRFILSKENTELALLHFVTKFGINGQREFPSWVPRFDESHTENGPILYSDSIASNWNAGGDIPHRISDCGDLRCLTLRGIIVSPVKSVLALVIDEDHLPRCIKHFYEMVKQASGRSGGPDDERQFKKSFIRALTTDRRQTNDAAAPPWGPDDLDWFMSIPDDQYDSTPQSIYDLDFAIISRRGPLVLLDNDMLCKAVIDDTRPGDLISVFLGAYVPHIIRPEGDHYTFVSECYVQDLMGGKAIDEWRAGNLKDEWIELH